MRKRKKWFRGFEFGDLLLGQCWQDRCVSCWPHGRILSSREGRSVPSISLNLHPFIIGASADSGGEPAFFRFSSDLFKFFFWIFRTTVGRLFVSVSQCCLVPFGASARRVVVCAEHFAFQVCGGSSEVYRKPTLGTVTIFAEILAWGRSLF